MKKSLFLLMAATALSVSAAQPLQLIFEEAGGTTHSVTAAGVSMTVADGNLEVQSAGGNLQLPLANLSKMYFSGDAAGIGNVVADKSAAVEVFAADGRSVGEYPSYGEACRALSAGVYVFRSGEESYKVQVK